MMVPESTLSEGCTCRGTSVVVIGYHPLQTVLTNKDVGPASELKNFEYTPDSCLAAQSQGRPLGGVPGDLAISNG
jgi:hypothetical protein